MEKTKRKTDKARFDTKLTKTQKDLFERAANLGGFRTLTDFVIKSTEERAKAIILEHETILASERDREIFFDAILNPKEPGKRLVEAAKRYKKLISGK